MHSDRGVTYTNTLRAIIAENGLAAIDNARLRASEPVEVVAVLN